MKRVVRVFCVGAAILAGCASEPAPSGETAAPAHVQTVAAADPAPHGGVHTAISTSVAPAGATPFEDRVVARIKDQPISMKQFLSPLIEAHGLNLLINLVQLEMVKDDAAKASVTVSVADFQQERQQTLDKLFKENDDKTQDQIDQAIKKNDSAAAEKLRNDIPHDHEILLDQFLTQQHISPTEFDIVLRINTYLRKIAEPAVNRSITEESLHNAFNQLYGETVRVKYIQLRTPLEVAEVQRRLAKGEKFGDLARELSTNRASANLDGDLPAFSIQTPGLPQNFKDVAFGLKVGQVSDMVESNGAYHLIKLEDRIPPKVVKFEQQREIVRKTLLSRAIAATVKTMRENLAEQAISGLKIEEPVMKKQFDERIQQRQNQIRDQQKIRDEMNKQHKLSTTRPAGEPPATAPSETPGPAAVPAPPATQPAAAANL